MTTAPRRCSTAPLGAGTLPAGSAPNSGGVGPGHHLWLPGKYASEIKGEENTLSYNPPLPWFQRRLPRQPAPMETQSRKNKFPSRVSVLAATKHDFLEMITENAFAGYMTIICR